MYLDIPGYTAGTSSSLELIVGAAGPNRPATLTDSDVSQGFFFPGGCHVYPHLDEVPDILVYTASIY
jgi:hypothetical protein